MMLLKAIRSILIFGSIGMASAEDAFADLFGLHIGPVLNTASTGFPTGTAISGLPMPKATAVRKLKVKYNLAPTSAPFDVPEPTAARVRRERHEAFGTIGTSTGTAEPTVSTGTGSMAFPIPTTFATALKPFPIPTAVAEKREDDNEDKTWWLELLKRWVEGEQAGSENLRRSGNVGAHM